MSLTNPFKPDNFSFLQCEKDFHESKEEHKLPQHTYKSYLADYGFLYEYTSANEDFLDSWPVSKNKERIETITIFLLLNAAIEGEI